MKNAYVIHGTQCSPEDYWYQWLANELRKLGLEVEVPNLVNINQEPAATTIESYEWSISEETILVGHSAGSFLILSLLEKIKAGLAVTVGGYMSDIEAGENPGLQDSYDIDAINSNCQNFMYFNSTNDPSGCNETKGLELLNNFGGKLVVMQDGHFGSEQYNQPYKQFPVLLNMIKGELS